MSAKVCIAVAIVAASSGPIAHPPLRPPMAAVGPGGTAVGPPNFASLVSANPKANPIPFDPSDPNDGSATLGSTTPSDPIKQAPIGFELPDYIPPADPTIDLDPADPEDPVGADPPADLRRADFAPAPVPEPSSLAILGIGLPAVLVSRRRRSPFARRSSGPPDLRSGEAHK
jgi:hypothetical protein